ncbi:MAG: SH3 domain-containing protein, partial [Verrucomicrobiota bacterium]
PGCAGTGSGVRAVLGGMAALVAAGWLTAWVSVVRGPNAAIAAREVPARFGPLEESDIAVNLADGTEVRVEQHRNGWLRVVDAEGRGGWVQGFQVARYHLSIP